MKGYISPIRRPYVGPMKKGGRHVHNYHRKIAYAVQMRGDNDDIPHVIYVGAPFALIRDVYAYLGKLITGNIEKLIVYHDHSCKYRNGKVYRRVVVEFYQIHEQEIFLETILLIAHQYMKRICNCSIIDKPLYRILNL